MKRSVRPRRAGSAVLIVLILLSVMGALVVSNTVALRRLKIELQLLEQKQIRALQERSGVPLPPPNPKLDLRNPK
jgi:hypothetical protein